MIVQLRANLHPEIARCASQESIFPPVRSWIGLRFSDGWRAGHIRLADANDIDRFLG